MDVDYASGTAGGNHFQDILWRLLVPSYSGEWKKQKTVPSSTCEAQYPAMPKVSKEVMFIGCVLAKWG